MYFQSDYILRMIEMAGGFFRRLMGLAEDQLTGEALRLLDDELRARFGLDLAALRALPVSSIEAIVADDGSRVLLMEHLLTAHALMERNGEEEAPLIDKALALLLGVTPDPLTRGHLYARLKLLIGRAGGLAGNAPLADVGEYFERLGHYDDAEDALYASGDAERLRAFYMRVACLGDEELARGGLPRVEVDEGLASLD